MVRGALPPIDLASRIVGLRTVPEKVAAVGASLQAQLKGRSSADLLDFGELVEAIRAVVTPERTWTMQSPVGDHLVCGCDGNAPSPVAEYALTWFEEWGWARESTRQLIVGECARCGAVLWFGRRTPAR